MVTSYFLSSTFVPVMSVWLLRHYHPSRHATGGLFSFNRWRDHYANMLQWFLRLRWFLVAGYLGAAILLVLWWVVGHPALGTEIFPQVDSGQFLLRLRAPDGTPLEDTEALAQDVLDALAADVGKEKVDITVSLVGTASYNYPINSIYLWTAGPQEAVLRIALKPKSGIRIEELKERMRERLPRMKRVRKPLPEMKDVLLSFEAGDIVGDVMSFGSPTPIEVVVSGKNYKADLAYTAELMKEMKSIGSLRDQQYRQPLDYPTVQVLIDRERAGLAGVTAADVGKALAPVTLSSRFLAPSFWRDPDSGIGFQVQLQVSSSGTNPKEALGMIPIKRTAKGMVLVRDVATILDGSMPGEDDRYNSVRMLSLTANIQGEDLGRVSGQVNQKVKAVNELLGSPRRGHRRNTGLEERALRRRSASKRAARRTAQGDHGSGPWTDRTHGPDVSGSRHRTGGGRGRDLPAADGILSVCKTVPHRGLHVPGGDRGSGVDAGADADDAQHPIVHGFDHGDRRGRGQRDPARDVRRAGSP
jgi:multidrug efflux pump subunit AcrB